MRKWETGKGEWGLHCLMLPRQVPRWWIPQLAQMHWGLGPAVGVLSAI